MSYIIPYKQYSPIWDSEDPDIVKDTLQRLFESLVRGNRLQKSKKSKFIERLEYLVASPSVKVRKWAYHCACFYRSDAIFQKCKDNLLFESEKENVLWALTALSTRYNDVISLRQCVSSDKHEEFINTISPNYLEDVLSLFSASVQLDTRMIISQSNSSDLATLAKIYGYPSLVHPNYSEINADVISKLTGHDDPYVREYAYWSLYHGGSSEKYLLSSPDDDMGTRKWQIAIQFESGDFDFITSILKPLSRNPDYIDQEVKEGILKGLGKIQYSEQFAPYISGWYALENTEFICLLIVDYMLINCLKNRSDGTFLEVLNDALTEDSLLSSHIRANVISNTPFGLEFKQPDANQISFKERSSTMSTFLPNDDTKVKPPKIFISHSSKDEKIVAAFVDLLLDIGLNTGHIFCTSVPGCGVLINNDIYTSLKREFNEHQVHVVFMLSSNYYDSPACLNEMGAAWILQTAYTSILLPGFEFREIDGAVNPRQMAIKLDEPAEHLKEKLGQMKNNFIETFGLSRLPDTRWESKRDAFIDKITVPINVAPK